MLGAGSRARRPWIATAKLVALGVVSIAACAVPDERTTDTQRTGDDAGGDTSTAVCTSGPMRCLAHIVREPFTGRIQADAATPKGFGADDLQSAYQIPTTTKTAHPTVAVVNAFGYAALESDLATYRAQYNLPACTVANGCLKIVNQQGQAAPLPADPPASDDWTIEAALDTDMVSAACPTCNILVVEALDDSGNNLFAAEDAAAALTPAVISNSWGGPEAGDVMAAEAHFNHPAIAIFTAAGDQGYNDQFSTTGTGPDYPGTSAHVIAVGATRLARDTSARGWTETAWSVTGVKTKSAGGSACSLAIPKPAYQTDSPCALKATTDIAAVGDPETGVAVYNASNAGWVTVGGTSAASPFVAAIFAATGNGKQSSGAFVAANASKLYDVVSGNNGTCDSGKLCNAGVGWDGPTGYGTPNATALMAAATTDSGDSGGGGCAATGGSAGAGGAAWLGLALVLRRRRARRAVRRGP